jgi:hypothetical protein
MLEVSAVSLLPGADSDFGRALIVSRRGRSARGMDNASVSRYSM